MATIAVLLSLILFISPSIVNSISIVAPQTFRPHTTYRIAVTSDTQTVSLYIAIEGRRNNGEVFSSGQELYLLPASSKIVELKIGDPGLGSYNLVARSTSGSQFSKTSPVAYVPKSYCVFIQTDKRVYNPTDVISFRILALDKYLLPLSNSVDVSILDSGGSPVKQWLGVPLEKGLFASELLLADQPALGEWTIQVETRGQMYTEKIQIADYVLPKFNLEINIPKYALFKDGSFTANVTARYFNGLPVKGELTLAVYPVFFSEIVQPVFSSPVRKVILFDGSTSVPISIKNDLNIAEDAARPIVVEAILEEQLTLRRQNSSARLLLLRTPYRMLVHAPEFFKPELPYKIQLEIVDSEGKPYTNGERVIQVERVWDDGAPPNVTTVPLSDQARGVYTYTPDRAHNRSTLNIVISYMEIKERLVNLKSSFTSGGEYLNAEVEYGSRIEGEDLKIHLRSTNNVDMINYALVSRGDVIDVVTKELAPPRNFVDLVLPTIPEMAPGVVLIAWYNSVGGEIVATSVYIPVQGLLRNKVSVLVNPQQSRPASTVEVTVTSEAGSHAAILAADSRNSANKIANEFGIGAGLDFMKVEREVESFSGISHSVYKETALQPTLGIEIGESNAADTFQKSGLMIISDGFLTYKNPGGPPPMLTVSAPRPPPAGPYAFTRLPPPPSPRYYLTSPSNPAWIVSNVTTGADGRGVVSRRAPQTPSTWTVGAFAIHPQFGLGIADPETYEATLPVFVEAEVPPTLQLGEALTIVVTLTSTLTTDIEVQVMFHNSEQYFDFEPLDNGVGSTKKIELYKRESVKIPAGGKEITAFLISATKTGESPIIIEVSGPGVSTSFFSSISVQNGWSTTIYKWALLDSQDSGNSRANVELIGPKTSGTIPGAVLATGDALAPSLATMKGPSEPASDALQALKPLIRACLVLDYLDASQQVGLMAESKSLAESGLQRVMAFKTKTGAFSIDSGSQVADVLMTIQTGGWLARCSKWLPVAPDAGVGALTWLVTAQAADGSWQSTSNIAPHLQNSTALTALAIIALVNVQGSNALYPNTIKKGVNFLLKSLPETEDTYHLALISRAFAETKHVARDNALTKLQLKSNFSDGERWWQRPLSASELRSPWINGSDIDVETAAHALIAVVSAGLLQESVPIARWLTRNGPADHPLKMEALAKFMASQSNSRGSSRLRITALLPGQETRQFNIDEGNSLIIQTQTLKNVRNVTGEAQGNGIGLIGLSGDVSSTATSPWPRYTLDPRVDAVSTAARLQLSVCTGFVPIPQDMKSGLTLMEVKLPSGFTADLDAITALQAARHVIGARLMDGGSKIIAWLIPSSGGERCATLPASRTGRVARQKPGWVTMKDIYDSSHRARVFFSPVQSNLCQICPDISACSKACGSASRQTSQNGGFGQSGETPNGRSNTPRATSGGLTFTTSKALIVMAVLMFL